MKIWQILIITLGVVFLYLVIVSVFQVNTPQPNCSENICFTLVPSKSPLIISVVLMSIAIPIGLYFIDKSEIKQEARDE